METGIKIQGEPRIASKDLRLAVRLPRVEGIQPALGAFDLPPGSCVKQDRIEETIGLMTLVLAMYTITGCQLISFYGGAVPFWGCSQ